MANTLNPSQDEMNRLLKIMSLEEIHKFINYMEAVKEEGYGGVCIEMENHRPSKFLVSGHISEILGKLRQKNYKPE